MAPRDCRITATEVQNTPIIMSLLEPDVTIAGQPALSFGIGITGIGATFSP
jgi:hypothetical protein